jgi:hypothetical protein
VSNEVIASSMSFMVVLVNYAAKLLLFSDMNKYYLTIVQFLFLA